MEILSSDTAIAETVNDYFSKVVQNLNIPKRKLPVEHEFLHKSSIGSNREMQT